MPEDLRNQEGIFPGYYDPLYDQTKNPFEPGSSDFDGYLQSISREILRRTLSPEKLSYLKDVLDSRGFLNRNIGDPSFREAVVKILNKIKLAGKVVHAYRLE